MERLRGTGMSVKQMREYAALAKRGEATLNERRALLAAHQQRVQDNIHRWSQALALIEAKVEFYEEWIVSGERPAVSPHGRIMSSAPSCQIVQVPRPELLRGSKHILFQMFDGSGARDRQHDR